MGQWSKLPADLLNVIEGHVVLYVDKVRIRVVCEAWNSQLPKLPNHKVKQLPWLLHPLDNATEATHGLFNPIDKKVYEIYLPEVQEKVFKGSSYGWMVTVEDMHSSSTASPADMYLINPLTRDRITLPPRSKFEDVVQYRPDQVNKEFTIRMFYDLRPNNVYHPAEDSDEEEYIDASTLSSHVVNIDLTWKVVLLSAPCDECVVVAIYGQARQLAWCRFNDDKWTHIYASIDNIIDIIFHKGKLYGLTNEGELFVFENIGTSLNTVVTEIASGVPIPDMETVYLAECSDGGLIFVLRHFKEKNYSSESLLQTIGFTLYKIDSLNSSLVELKSIGDDILVLGFNSSISISSSQLPGHKGNQIYFSDSLDEKERSYELDMGVFNLNDGTLELLPGFSPPIWPRPIWINIC